MDMFVHRGFLFLCMLFCTIHNYCFADPFGIINVRGQKEFDELGNTIYSLLSRGCKDINIIIAPGTFYYKNDHIDLSGKNYPETSIRIKGRGAILVARGTSCGASSNYNETFIPNHTLINERNDVIDIWSPFYQTSELIEVVSSASKLCRVKNISNASGISYAGSFIQITSWFQSFVYQIDRIEGEYIYFTADNLDKGYQKGWNVNNDYNYGNCYPRYRLANVRIGDNGFFIDQDRIHTSDDSHSIFECNATRFLVLGYETYLKSLDIERISFVGNSFKGELGVFSFLSPYGSVIIRNCQFKGIRSSRVVSVGNKNKVSVLNCCFEGCAESGVVSSLGAENTVVSNCRFIKCGTGLKNSFCVRCYGVDFRIDHNTFENYGYSAIGIGCGYGNKRESRISGVVEYNTLRYTSDYKNCKDQHTLMDGGAIYIFTQNDDTQIRYNYINGYTGMHDNRGIFCDDGASNLKIVGNVITNIDNSYSIDSRRVASVETESRPSNMGNVVVGNIVDGVIKIEGNEDKGNGCEYGTNYFLVGRNRSIPSNIVKNVDVLGEEIVLDYTGEKKGKIGLSKTSYRRLKKAANWKELKKFVIRKNK